MIAIAIVGAVALPAAAADEPTAEMTIAKGYGTASGAARVDDGAANYVPTVVRPGEPFFYSVEISCIAVNSGGCVDAILTDTLPAPLVLTGSKVAVSGSGSGANAPVVIVAGDDRSFTVNFRDKLTGMTETGLGDGSVGTVTIEAMIPLGTTADAAGILVNTASATATNALPVSDPAPVAAEIPDLFSTTIEKTVEPTRLSAIAGRPVTYTLAAANTSNRSVDELWIQDAADGQPSPFEHLELTGVTSLTPPTGATHVRVDVLRGGTWTTGTQVPVTTSAGDLLTGATPLSTVEGVRFVFLRADGQPVPATSLADGAKITLGTITRPSITSVADAATLQNTASSTVVVGGDPKATDTDAATVTVSNVPASVTIDKVFKGTIPPQVHVLAVGEKATIVLTPRNTGSPLSQMTVTEPSVGTFADQGLQFTGFVATDVTWPEGAAGASVTYAYADGTSQTLTAGARDTLPAPATRTVASVVVTFTGDIDRDDSATLPLSVTALPLPDKPGPPGDPVTIPDSRQSTNEAKVEGTPVTGLPVSDTDAADVRIVPLVVETEVTKNIVPAEPWSAAGTRVPVSLVASVAESSTAGSDYLEIIDGPGGPFWDVVDLTGLTKVPVPGGALLTADFWDGAAWIPFVTDHAGPSVTQALAPAQRAAAQGLRLTYRNADGSLLEPGFVVLPTFDTVVRETARYTLDGAGDSATVADLAAAAPAPGFEVTNQVTTKVENPALSVPVDTAQDSDTAHLRPVPGCVPGDPCGPDIADKTWGDTVVALKDEITSPTLYWGTGGMPYSQVTVADPAGLDVTPVLDARSVYDVFDLVAIPAITPATDPAIAGDAVTAVELAQIDGSWLTVSTCTSAAPCVGGFPGYTLTPAQQLTTIGVRLTFASAQAGDTVSPTDSLRPVTLDLRLRRTLRSDPAETVHGTQHGVIYNIPGSQGMVRNTVEVAGTLGGVTHVSRDEADVTIVDEDVNVALSKDIDDESSIGLPPAGTPAEKYPETTVRLVATNTSTGGTTRMEITDPGPAVGADPAPGTMYDSFDLVSITGISTPAAATFAGARPVTSTLTVTRRSASGVLTQETYPVVGGAVPSLSDLSDVVGVSILHEGDLAPSKAVDPDRLAAATMVFRLRTTTRVGGTPVVRASVTNDARVTLSRPGGQGIDTATDNAADSVVIEEPSYGVDAAKEIGDAPSTDPASSDTRNHKRKENRTSPVTVTLQARPTGTVRTTDLTFTDATPTFFNAFTFVGFDEMSLPASVGRVKVDALVTTLVEGGGGTTLAYADANAWQTGTWTDAVGGKVTPVLPPGVAASDVVGLRVTFQKDAAGGTWEHPSRPTLRMSYRAAPRTHLRSDPARVVPTTRPEHSPAPGETVKGLTANTLIVDATGAWGKPNAMDPVWTASDSATDESLNEHLLTKLDVRKFPGNGNAGNDATSDPAPRKFLPGADIPYEIRVKNIGQRAILDPTIIDTITPSGGSNPLVVSEDADPVFTIKLDGATVPGLTVTYDQAAGTLAANVPSGFLLAPGSTVTITAALRFRDALAAGTDVLNSVVATADRPLDECVWTENAGGAQSDKTSRATTCASETTVEPAAAAPLRMAKAVKGVEAGDPSAAPGTTNFDDLGRLRLGDNPDCTVPNAPNGGDYYVHPCAPITRPGGTEQWRATFTNTGNLPANRVVAIDVLPAVGDRGVIATGARSSAFDVTLTGEFAHSVTGGTDPAVTYFYTDVATTSLTQSCNRSDIEQSLASKDAPCVTDRWKPVAGASPADLATATAVKTVVQYPAGGGLPVGAALALTFRTRTPAFAPNAGANPVAYNSIGFGSRGYETNGTAVDTPPLEPRKVGVAMATGKLELSKTVTKPTSWRSSSTFPATFPFSLSCTSDGETVPLAGSAGRNVTVDGDTRYTVNVPLDANPATPDVLDPTVVGGANLNLPLFAECAVVERGVVGSEVGYVPAGGAIGSGTVVALAPVTGNGAASGTGSVADAWEPVTAVPGALGVTNTYAHGGFSVTKTVDDGGALDAAGQPVKRTGWAYGFTASCIFNGAEVLEATGERAFTLVDGATKAFDRVPVGSVCTVTEAQRHGAQQVTTAIRGVSASAATINQAARRVTFTIAGPGDKVGDGDAAETTVDFTNEFTTGSINVTKRFTGSGLAAWSGDTVELRLVCTIAQPEPMARLAVFDRTWTETKPAGGWKEFTKTVDNLPTGASCTLTENPDKDADATSSALSPAGGRGTVGSTIAVVATNTFTMGSVQVTKALAGLPGALAPATTGLFTFELVCTRAVGATTETWTVGSQTITGAGAVTWSGLPTNATCVATETSATLADGTPFPADQYAVTPGTPLTVGNGTAVSTTRTNTFAVTSLSVSKSITGSAAGFAPTSFGAALTCTWHGTPVTLANGGRITVVPGTPTVVTNIPVGAECSLVEEGDHLATNVSYTVQQGAGSPTPVTPADTSPVGAGGTTGMTIINEYDLSVGFDVTKVVRTDAVDAAGHPVAIGRSYSFTIACTFNGNPVPGVPADVTVAVGETVSVTGMPARSICTVTEQGAGDASTPSVVVVGDDSATTTTDTATFTTIESVAGQNGVSVTFTNTYPVGALEVTKAIAGDGGVLADGTPVWAVGPFTVNMVCTLPGAGVGGVGLVVWGGSHTFERADSDGPWTAADLTWRQEKLPVGADCVLTEPTRGGANAVAFTAPDGTVTADAPSATPATAASARVEVTDDLTDPVEVTVTNTFTTGSLEVTKTIEGPTAPSLAPALDGTYEVTLVCTRPVDGTPVPVAVPGGATRAFTGTGTTRTVTYEGLPTGASCELAETTSAPAAQIVEYTIGTRTPSATPPTFEVLEGTATEGITVTNTFADGSVVARKLVVGDGAGHAPADFSATVSCTWHGADVTLPNGGHVTLPGDGTIVTVGDAPEGAICSILEDTTGAGQTDVEVSAPVTLVAGETATLTVTNTYELTGLTVTKRVVGARGADGSPVSYTTSFAFEASCVFRGSEVLPPADREFTLTQDGARALTGVPVGSVCTVTEVDAAGATSTTVTQVADEVAGPAEASSSTTLTLARGVDHDVVVTNTLPTGPVTVTKVVEGPGAALWGTETFEVHLVCTAQDVAGGTVHDGRHELSMTSPTVVVAHLPAGATCAVTETRTGGADVSTVRVGSPTVTDATDALATPASFVVRNYFDVAAIDVLKQVVGIGAELVPDAEFVVELVCTREVDGVEHDVEVPGGARRTLSTASGLTTRFDGLPTSVDCFLEEIQTGGADATALVVETRGGELRVAGTRAEVNLDGDDVMVRVVNRFGEVDDDDSLIADPEEPADDPRLPVTGAQALGAAGLAALLILVGFVLVVVRRRRTA